MVLWRDDDESVQEARQALARLAQRRAPDWSQHDRDDLVQDAMAKALAQHQLPGRGTPLRIRAHVTFRDVLTDGRRKRARTREDLCADPHDARVESDPTDARLRLGELCHAMSAALGTEIVEFAVLCARGYTATAIAELPGWDAARVDRVRKRLRRKQALVETMPELVDSQRKEAS